MDCEIDPRTHLPSTTTTQKIPVQLKDKNKNSSLKTTKITTTTSRKTTTASTFPSTPTTGVTTTTTTLKVREPPKSTKAPNETQHLLYSNHHPGNSLEVSEEYQTQIEDSLVMSRNKEVSQTFH